MLPVSVIIAVYNGEKYLEAAIESLLNQTHAPIPILVVDDGSKDNTAQIARKYGSQVRYFFQANRGQPSALNLGISMAQSSYIAFLDADDLYLPEKTALQLEVLEKTPEIDMVFGYVEQFFDSNLPIEQRKWVCPPEAIAGYALGAGLFRKKCFEQVGLLNEEQKIGAFIDWYMRAKEKGLNDHLIPQSVLQRRIHGDNVGIHSKNARVEYLQIVKTALKRRTLIS